MDPVVYNKLLMELREHGSVLISKRKHGKQWSTYARKLENAFPAKHIYSERGDDFCFIKLKMIV